MHIAFVLTPAFGDDDNESSGNFINACLIKAYFNAHKYEPSGKTNYGRHLRRNTTRCIGQLSRFVCPGDPKHAMFTGTRK